MTDPIDNKTNENIPLEQTFQLLADELLVALLDWISKDSIRWLFEFLALALVSSLDL